MKEFIDDKTLNQYLDLIEEINMMRQRAEILHKEQEEKRLNRDESDLDEYEDDGFVV